MRLCVCVCVPRGTVAQQFAYMCQCRRQDVCACQRSSPWPDAPRRSGPGGFIRVAWMAARLVSYMVWSPMSLSQAACRRSLGRSGVRTSCVAGHRPEDAAPCSPRAGLQIGPPPHVFGVGRGGRPCMAVRRKLFSRREVVGVWASPPEVWGEDWRFRCAERQATSWRWWSLRPPILCAGQRGALGSGATRRTGSWGEPRRCEAST